MRSAPTLTLLELPVDREVCDVGDKIPVVGGRQEGKRSPDLTTEPSGITMSDAPRVANAAASVDQVAQKLDLRFRLGLMNSSGIHILPCFQEDSARLLGHVASANQIIHHGDYFRAGVLLTRWCRWRRFSKYSHGFPPVSGPRHAERMDQDERMLTLPQIAQQVFPICFLVGNEVENVVLYLEGDAERNEVSTNQPNRVVSQPRYDRAQHRRGDKRVPPGFL